MTHSINIVSIILLLGASQGLFLAFLLINKTENVKPNRLLAFLMISYSAFIAESSLSGTKIAIAFPHLLGLAAGVIFLVPPIHYLYTLSLISTNFSFSKKHFFHLSPFVSFYLYFLYPFYLKNGEYKIEFIQEIATKGSPPDLIFFNWISIIQGIVYMSMTLRLLKKHFKKIRNHFSSLEKINLKWLRDITIMTFCLWIIGFMIELLQLFGLGLSVDFLTAIAAAVLIYAMGYLGLKQHEIFAGNTENNEMSEIIKYERSGLSNENAQKIHQSLIQLMENKKPFKDSNLKLNQLAKMVATTPNYLSQVINEKQNQSFFDFVNWYRIEEAKKRIGDPAYQQLTLLSIAYDVGFNSKSTFNMAFKKHTNMTPSQFKKFLTSNQMNYH